MRYRIEIAQRALKALKDIPSAERERIRMAIRGLAGDPRPRGCKKLQDSPEWRIRVGVYRVVYQIEEGQLLVLVVKVGHRKDVYRKG
jgi:mRNA interferase RelE/StbE